MKYLIILSFICFSFCKNQTSLEGKIQNDSLIFVKSIKSFETPESVVYYPEKNVLFISNINGAPTDKDFNGFISKIDTNGNIISLHWIKGLNAPKGMKTYGSLLYVSDITELIIIDINEEKIIKKVNFKASEFLNDIEIDTKGNVYISDSQKGVVYKYSNGEIIEYLPKLEGPNGLLIEKDTLFVGCDKKILKVNLINKEIMDTIESPTGIDGLKKVSSNDFLISDWQGNINIVNSKESKLLISAVDEKNAADFEYIQGINKLFVPTFFDNKVEIYTYKN